MIRFLLSRIIVGIAVICVAVAVSIILSGMPGFVEPTKVAVNAVDDLELGVSFRGASFLTKIEAPEDWLSEQTEFVQDAALKKQFVIGTNGLIGVRDEHGQLATWPDGPRLRRSF